LVVGRGSEHKQLRQVPQTATLHHRRSTMKYFKIAASIVALGLLSPVAMAASFDTYDCSRFDSHTSYCTFGDAPNISSKRPAASVIHPAKRGRIGDFIDETIEERHERSSNR
jgi:hypothetical protein